MQSISHAGQSNTIKGNVNYRTKLRDRIMDGTQLKLYQSIREATTKLRGYDRWLLRADSIHGLLDSLDPGTPDDGTAGFLAYNVPNKSRMKMKTGRFLARKLSLNSGFLPDDTIRGIADDINFYLFPDMCFRLDSGDTIRENYRNDIDGGGSCMSGHHADYVGLYVDNPGVYRQLVMQYGNDMARAMVIKLDNGQFLLDRIYSSSSVLVEKMRQYAIAQNWYYRKHTGYGSENICDPSGEDITDYDIFVVSGLQYTEGEVPYQDTLTQYEIDGNRLNIGHVQASDSWDGTLDNTDGTLNGGFYVCVNCEESVNEDEVHSVDGEHFCDDCYCELFSTCEKCYEVVPCDDINFIVDKEENWCDCCTDDNAIVCGDCDGIVAEDYSHIESENKTVCISCLENYSFCEDCNETFKEVDDDCLCEDCAKEKAEQECRDDEIRGTTTPLDAVGQSHFSNT